MNNLYLSMEEELNAIEESNPNFKAVAAIKICQYYLEKLKKYVEDSPFKTIEEEIHFFKFIKPKFLSKLIFHVKWHNTEFRKPPFDIGSIKDYYHKELKKIYRFAKENAEFHRYMSAEKNMLDKHLFTRNNLHDFASDSNRAYICKK